MTKNIISNIAHYLYVMDGECENEKSYLDDAEKMFNEHKSTLSDTPSLYVGTYYKYNSGSLFGMWVDLSTFDDKDDFFNFCRAIHSDENDPELMFQDYEGFPEGYYHESCGDKEIIKIIEYAQLDDDDKLLLEAYIGATGNADASIDDARDAYFGQYDSYAELAESICEDCGYEIPDWLMGHVDWEGLGRDYSYDFSEFNGYYFHN